MSHADLTMLGQMSRIGAAPPPPPERASGGSLSRDRFHARLLKAFENWTTEEAVETFDAAEILVQWNKRSVLQALDRLKEMGLVKQCGIVKSRRTKNKTMTWKRISPVKESEA